MKGRYLLIIALLLLCGCQDADTKKVTSAKENEKVLTIKNEVLKNDQNFKNNQDGKNNLLLLMANSVDYYNYVNGSMVLTMDYQGQMQQIKYDFQINVPDYHSFIYQVSSTGFNEQCFFRDSEKMYFYNGNIDDLKNNDLSELIKEKKMIVEQVSANNNLFKYRDLSLQERIDNFSSTRVANDLYGDVAPYVFPEEIALYQLGTKYDNYDIKDNTDFIDREVFVVEGTIDDTVYNKGTISLFVDKQTGILLKYEYKTDVSTVTMEMEQIAIDQDDQDDFYLEYIKNKKN